MKTSSGNKRAEAEAEAKVEAKFELQLKLGQAPTFRLLNFVAKFKDKASYCLPNNGDDCLQSLRHIDI